MGKTLISPDLKAGDLVFTTDRKPWSRLIRRITKSRISHVGIVVDIRGYPVIAEMLAGGLTLTPIHDKKDIVKVGRFFEFGSYEANKVSDMVLDHWCNDGIDYDWRGVFAFISSRVQHCEDKYFCSEYVAFVLRECVDGLEFPELDHEIDPSDLITHLSDEIFIMGAKYE
jgi:hypothetical protein